MTLPNNKIRSQATKTIFAIVYEGRSANDLLPRIEFENPADTALFKALVLDSCRYFLQLQFITEKLMRKKLRNKDGDIFCLIIMGLYQLAYSRIPDHAAISETVDACDELKKPWAKQLINAVLRNFLRDKDSLISETQKNWDSKFSIPDWLIAKIKPSYKGQVESILQASNQQAPLVLRTNRLKTTRDQYREILDEQGISSELHPVANDALVLLEPVNVRLLPNFAEGWVSVQDAAAQLSAQILQPKAGEVILDACAAPGGKSMHLLEASNNNIQLTSVDIDENRCQKIRENLERLHFTAEVIVEDAIEFLVSTDRKFDAILLDVPCSATGVIRRHPDIKLLRRESDIDELVKIQSILLERAWGALKQGGRLLYATCSIVQKENVQQITRFLEARGDAELVALDKRLQELSATEIGCQILPGQLDMDGFYYCLLQKSS